MFKLIFIIIFNSDSRVSLS